MTTTADDVRSEGRDTRERDEGAARRRTAGVVLGVTAVVVLLLVAFAWPATHLAPHHVPVALAGPGPAVEQLRGALGGAGEDAFDVSVVADRAAAVEAVRDREVYGAVVVGPDGGEVLTASAASPAVAAALGEVAAGVPAAAGGPFAVSDVVALPADDPRGAGLASSLLPLVLGGLASGATAALVVRRRVAAPVAVGVVAVLGGLAVAGVLQGWLGALAGSYWSNAGVVALGIAAIGYPVLGLFRLLGEPGIGLAALLVMLVGNPLSGVTSAPELLPEPWGALGQWLPPGAAATALRSTSFFDGAGASTALVVLGLWVLAGLALSALPGRASRAAR